MRSYTQIYLVMSSLSTSPWYFMVPCTTMAGSVFCWVTVFSVIKNYSKPGYRYMVAQCCLHECHFTIPVGANVAMLCI